MDPDEAHKSCHSIKSKKNPTERCVSKATHGDFCARHRKSKILWSAPPKKKYVITKKQRTAIEKIYNFWVLHGRRKVRKTHGPATFVPEISQNDRDIFNLEPVTNISLMYHFSYKDSNSHVWTFDLRFLVQMLHYGNDLKNPYNQELLLPPVIKRLQTVSQKLIRHKIPVLYTDTNTLTPEQAWNQKVLDVFLKLNSMGYAANLLWFEAMNIRQHHNFYTSLYNLWTHNLGLTHAQKEVLIPAYDSGRAPLFRWTPEVIIGNNQELKWWRKNNLNLMNTFLTRGKDRAIQSTGALYILMALVQSSPGAAEAFHWLA
jgi:hypothetical protein